MKRFLPAVVLLLFVATIMATATYAWFSMNTQTQVTGMALYATAKSNIMIADDELSSTARRSEGEFTPTLSQTVGATLMPVSTIDGNTFYYTRINNVNGMGDAVEEDYVLYNENDTVLSAYTQARNDANNAARHVGDNYYFDQEFNANYKYQLEDENSAIIFGYIDYVFQIKATNVSGAAAKIQFTQLDLVYNGVREYTNAYRVAAFVENISNASPSGGVGTLTNIFALDGASNFDGDKAVNGTSTLGTVTKSLNQTAVLVEDVPAQTAAYYKVVIRLWLEGEDVTCTSESISNLRADWTLTVSLEMSSDYLVPIRSLKKYMTTTYAGATYYYDGTRIYNEDFEKIADISTLNASVKAAFFPSTTVPGEPSKTFFWNDGVLYDSSITPVALDDDSDEQANKAKAALILSYKDALEDEYYYNKGIIYDETWADVTSSCPADVKAHFYKSTTYLGDIYYYNNGVIYDDSFADVTLTADVEVKTALYDSLVVGDYNYYSDGTYVYRLSGGVLAALDHASINNKLEGILEDYFETDIV